MSGAWPRLAAWGVRQPLARTDSVRVAIDAMGGDHGPEATVAGAVLATRELGVPIWLVGHADVLRAKLAEHDAGGLPLTIQHAPDVIRMEDAPVAAVRRKPRSSLRVAFDLLQGGRVDALVSAGNSGAVMAAGLFTVGSLPGVERPAIAVPIPATRGLVVLLDAGASVEADPRHLAQYALMGHVYARVLSGLSAPRVGLLSNGREESKGTHATRAASRMLRQLPVQFVGYVEGRELCDGDVDVVVCDGFVGNAVLKTIEGFGALATELLSGAFKRTWQGRLGYLLARGAMAEIRERLDYAEYGGAPLLGLGGVAIVAHGSSGARAIRNAVRVAHDSVRLEKNRQIVDAISGLQAPPPATRRRRRLWQQIKGQFGRIRDGEPGAVDVPKPSAEDEADEPSEGRSR